MRAMDQGEVIGGVVNSMSRLMHLVSCHTTTGRNSQALRSTVAILKQLKPVLDEALNLNLANASSHLTLALEDLDAAVNQSREHLEMWHHKMPKIYTVSITLFIYSIFFISPISQWVEITWHYEFRFSFLFLPLVVYRYRTRACTKVYLSFFFRNYHFMLGKMLNNRDSLEEDHKIDTSYGKRKTKSNI